SGHCPDVARKRQLGDVEFLVAEGAKENLLGIERQVGDRAPFHPHPTLPDRTGTVVVAAGNRNRHLDHGASSQGWLCERSRRERARQERRTSARAYLLPDRV